MHLGSRSTGAHLIGLDEPADLVREKLIRGG